MKRKRRVEVVRYTRRVTVSEGGAAPADADERPAIDLNPAAPGWVDEPAPAADAVQHQTPRRTAASGLRDLLRLRR